MNNWTPLNDKILIRRIPDVQESGIFEIPDIAKRESHRGVVVATGPGKFVEGVNGDLVRKPIEVKAGDVVRFSLNDWESFDETHVIVMEQDLFFIEKPN